MLFLVILLACSARILGQTDMGDNMFSFHEKSDTSYVHLIPDRNESLTEATVCIRVNPSQALVDEYCLFSLATRNHDNEFTLFFRRNSNIFIFATNSRSREFQLNSTHFQEWTSTCVSWCSSKGEVIVWINEKPFYSNNFEKGHVIASDRLIIIGQDQDKYGDSFEAKQSFVGHIADINMWDKVLTTENITDYLNGNDIGGNVINWKALRYKVYGYVSISKAPCILV